jgi:hypothetical protein
LAFDGLNPSSSNPSLENKKYEDSLSFSLLSFSINTIKLLKYKLIISLLLKEKREAYEKDDKKKGETLPYIL